MKALLTAFFLSLYSLGALSAIITLYEVAQSAPTPPAALFLSNGISVVISAIEVGEKGKTTYVEEEVITETISYATATVTAPPVTFTDTFEEDASGLFRQKSFSYPPGSSLPGGKIIQSCKFQGTTAGSCVDVVEFPQQTSTVSYSSTLLPAHTVTKSASMPGKTQDSGGLTQNNIWSTCQLIKKVFGMWVTFLVA